MTNTKIEAFGTALKDALSRYLTTAANPNPVVPAHDASGDLYLSVRNSATDNAIVKFETQPAPASGDYTSLGQAQTVYTPHITKLGFDVGSSGVQAHETVVVGAVVATDKLTINGHDFTAVSPGPPSTDEFVATGVPATTATNLAAAINTSATVGIAGIVTALAVGANVTITAVAYGTLGNAITVTQTGGHITVPSGTLLGGVNLTAAGTSEFLKTLLVALAAPSGTALVVYEKAGIAESDLTNDALVVVTIRNLSFGLLAQM